MYGFIAMFAARMKTAAEGTGVFICRALMFLLGSTTVFAVNENIENFHKRNATYSVNYKISY